MRTLAYVGLLFLAFPFALGAQEFGRVEVNVNSANVRVGPSTTATVIRSFPAGTGFDVMSRSGEWFEINLAGSTAGTVGRGYIHESVVAFFPAPTVSIDPEPEDLASLPDVAGREELTAAVRDTLGAGAAGAAAGRDNSTAVLGFTMGALSFAMPGSGFLYLLLLDSGDVEPNFVEQAHLRERSPEYSEAWADAYEKALTSKQKRTIIGASAVGTVAGYFIVWKRLLDSGY